MHTDELRREVAAMADEVESFAGDVHTLHRKRRRSRLIACVAAAAAITGLAISAVALAGSRHDNTVRVSSAPSKEVAPSKMTHIDAFVVPATQSVKLALDQSPFVGQYAFVPAANRAIDSLLMTDKIRAALCALRSSDGYAVAGTAPGVDVAGNLTGALRGVGRVFDAADQLGAADAEVFLKVGATVEQTSAVNARLQRDPDVRSFRFITTDDAYNIFRTEFADEPALVQSTKPSDLPESFRVILRPGRSAANIVDRYSNAPGVDVVITQVVSDIWKSPQGGSAVEPAACAGS